MTMFCLALTKLGETTTNLDIVTS